MVTGYVDSADIQALSKKLFQSEDPKWDEDTWINYLDCEAHPLVLELLGEHGDHGVAGALAYLADGEEPDVGAVIRWMRASAYKGQFDNEEAFARDQFESAVGDLFAGWGQGEQIGFPEIDMSEAIDWEYIAEAVRHGEEWYFIETDNGAVHVFDLRIDLDPYREAPAETASPVVGSLGKYEWFALCDRDAVNVLDHPAFPAGVRACQRCTDFQAS